VRDWLDVLLTGVEIPGVARVALVGGVTIVVVLVLQRVYERPARRLLTAGPTALQARAPIVGGE
jgi:hypothetical protein